MLLISNTAIDISAIEKEYSEDSIQMQLLNKMSASAERYKYDNLDELKFELNLRKEIVDSAINLNNSDMSFAIFRNSECNPKYWSKTQNGGFLLNNDVKPNEAINDIFANGGDYATECATAMMIVYYKALLNIYGDNLFNNTFHKIYLMGWDVKEALLKEVGTPQIVADFLLGDRGYFSNPDFNPETPEWDGENVIILPNSLYYGHGIGIEDADKIIQALNSNRKEGSVQSAYLLNETGRPNFKKLFNNYKSMSARMDTLVWKPFPAPIST